MSAEQLSRWHEGVASSIFRAFPELEVFEFSRRGSHGLQVVEYKQALDGFKITEYETYRVGQSVL